MRNLFSLEKRKASPDGYSFGSEELKDLEAKEWIAEKLDLQPINIRELITFYPMLRETAWERLM